MKPKSFVSLLVGAIILGCIIGGALAGGIAIGKNQESSQTSQYSSLPSGLGNITGQGDFQFPGNNTGMPSGSRGTMGTVESVEGSVVTLKAQGGTTVIVNVSDSTSIQKTVEGSLSDIATGNSITVSGNKNTDGSIDATSITITSGTSFGGLTLGQ